MAKIRVELRTPDGAKREVALPDDVPIHQVTDIIVTTLGLPATGPNGEPLRYGLTDCHRRAPLPPDRTLEELGIGDGSRLVIVGLPHEPGKVHVILRAPRASGDREQWASLPDDAPVRRIIFKLMHMMSLPGLGPDGQPISYKFHCRASGKQLYDEQTLSEANVQDGDVLAIIEEITAGGGFLVAGHSHMAWVTSSSRGTYAGGPPAELDGVDCTVFAPPEAPVGDSIMVQVWAHGSELSGKVRDMAREFDAEAERRGVTSLATKIARGSTLTFELVMRELVVSDPLRTVTWQGTPEQAMFEVSVPPDARVGSHIGTVLISQGVIPIGEIKFKLKVVAEVVGDGRSASGHYLDPCGQARRYETAFISYASADRDEVLRCVRLLPAVGIRFFQDVLELAPGDRWQDELWAHIDESDVMLLFWSSAARASEWVEREWRHALERKGDDYIRPIIIEGPPPVPPPPELSHLHFDDKVVYFLRATASTTSGSGQAVEAGKPGEADKAGEAIRSGVAYVKRLRSKGKSATDIRERLLRAGWTDRQIGRLLDIEPLVPTLGQEAPDENVD